SHDEEASEGMSAPHRLRRGGPLRDYDCHRRWQSPVWRTRGPRGGRGAVPFVLWFNFAAGFLYIAAGGGLFARQKWTVWLAGAIAVATLGVFGAFGLHVLQGGAYETRIVGAMIVRIA